MKIALISFTRAGAETCRKMELDLSVHGHFCEAFGKDSFAEEVGISPLKGSLSQWTKAAFDQQDALIFVGACGIAVRAIAPFIQDKTVDPAVVVVDEKGKFAISLLSGHLGGANDLTREIAEIIEAEPVITTATDLNGRFAVDNWAKKNRLRIGNMQLAKEISAAIVNGEIVGVFSEYPIGGEMPEQLRYLSEEAGVEAKKGSEVTEAVLEYPKVGFSISIHEKDGPFEKTLQLVPRTVTVGIGCRKGISLEAVEDLFYQVFKEQKLSVHSIGKICSIDIKKEEAALRQLADKLKVPLQFFTAEELEQLPGEFTSSDFVNQITGVNNVCERTAVLGSKGALIVKKQALNGVTVAIAVRKEVYRWNQE